MKCSEVMNTEPTKLRKDATLDEAIQILSTKHRYNILVVDNNDRFAGEIRTLQFAKLLLPETAGMDVEVHSERELSETVDDLKQRLLGYIDRPIEHFVDTELPTVGPDTPLIDALMFLRDGAIRLPVVDPKSGKLLGAVSVLTILRTLHAETLKSRGASAKGKA
jgi:CBS domain-containing protein